jgi:hypothetical protein
MAATSNDIHQRHLQVGGGAGLPSSPVTIVSVVFTFVVSLVVVAASVAAVLRLALAESEQPPTDRRAARRARSEARAAKRVLASRSKAEQRRTEPRARSASRTDTGAASAAIDLDRVSAFGRIRSGLALLLLLAFVGTLLAAVIGTLLFMAGLALRNAVS